MKRVLLVCNYDFTFNKYLSPLANSLFDEGYEVSVLCDGKKINHSLVGHRKINFFNIQIPKSFSFLAFMQSIIAIHKVLRKNSFDIVNVNNRNASFLARVANILLPFSKTKIIYTARGMYFHDAQKKFNYKIIFFLEVVLSFFTDLVLSQSLDDINYITKNFLVKKEKFIHIGNGIDANKFNVKNVNGVDIDSKRFIVCSIGRIARAKGLEDMLFAFKKFSDEVENAYLLFIGGVLHKEQDHIYADFLEQIKRLGIEKKVHITGLVDNVEDYLAVCDVYLHTAHREGMPRSVLEAMSMEKIVLASRIRGAKEIITHGHDGFLFEKGDCIAISEKLKSICQLNEDQKVKIQKAARDKVVSSYTQDQYISKQVEAFSRV